VLKEQYLIGRVLGQGGFGTTYMGWDLYLDTPVAIKEYYPTGTVMRESNITLSVTNCTNDDGVHFQNSKERFLREAKSLARFTQMRGIVQIKNFFLANNTAYIVMEYVEGITLKQYVKNQGGKLNAAETFTILKPVMEDLCKVHRTGLVHRDISPDNIMMLPDGGTKILDFGAVKDVATAAPGKDLTKSTQAILKQGYAPIEQYLKKGSLGAWTDVYALCATIFYCLCGETPQSAPERMLEGEQINWTEIAPDLTEKQVKALEHGMQIRAENRTVSVDQLYQELFASDKQEAIKTPRIVEKKETQPKPKIASPESRQSFKGLTAIISVIIVLIVGIFTFGSKTISGSCGDDLRWQFYVKDGKLTIVGTGDMYDYAPEGENTAPWREYSENISSVSVSDEVTSIGAYAFWCCENLADVQFGNSLETIKPYAFHGCSLSDLTLPDSLRTIDAFAFSCNAMTDVVFPDGLEYIGSGALGGMDSLKTVTLGVKTRLNYDTWSMPLFGNGCPITVYGFDATMAQDYAEIMGHEFLLRSQIELKEAHDWSIRDLPCGDNVYAFFDEKTGFLKIEGSGPMWDFSGTWYEGVGEQPPAGRDLSGWSSFREEIRVVSIHDGVTSIGENAFENCRNLEDIYFGNTVKTIGFQAFLSTSVEEIVLPESVQYINFAGFNWCEKLRYVRLPETLPALEIGSFISCFSLEEFFVGRDTDFKTDPLGYNPFCHEAEKRMPENLTIYSLQNSKAEAFAAQNNIPFIIGIRGYHAEAEGQCGKDAWWFLSGNTMIVYGTGATDAYADTEEERFFILSDGFYSADHVHITPPGFSEYTDRIENVIVLPGITELADNFLRRMENVQWIDLGTVNKISLSALSETDLREVIFPESVALIRGWSLSNCENLSRVTVTGNTRMELSIFFNTPNLREVHLGRMVVLQDNPKEGDLFNQTDHEEKIYPSEELVFYVYTGSDGLRYAQEHGITYQLLS